MKGLYCDEAPVFHPCYLGYPHHKELLVKSDDNKVEWDAVALTRLADVQKKEKAEVQAQTAGATSEAVTQSSITELPTSKDVAEAA